MQIPCNSCMYSQTFFPSAVRLWNRVPSDTCYLAPDSFKLELLKINLIWSRTKFLSHRTARSYFLKLAYAHSIGFLSTWPAPAAWYYSTTELALVLAEEDMNHADGISRHRLTPHLLSCLAQSVDLLVEYHANTGLIRTYDYTILSSFRSQCKCMWDLKLFNVLQLTQLSERLFQLSTSLLLKANFLISSLHHLLNNFLSKCLCLPPSSAAKNKSIHSVIPIQNLKGFD